MVRDDVNLIAFTENPLYRNRLAQLAEQLGIPFVEKAPMTSNQTLLLQLDADGLSLAGKGMALRGDFRKMLPRIHPGVLSSELLVRAAKIKHANHPLTVIDATAGLGEDSLLLAAAGYSVQLYEYNPVIAALLQDALRRAADMPELAEIVARMQAHVGDSITILSGLSAPPDIILLDPMFPARQKSALVKKKFQLLQQLEQPCTDEAELLQAAINIHPHKIVIKRPPKGPYLAGVKPSYSIQGKGVRYDCIVM